MRRRARNNEQDNLGGADLLMLNVSSDASELEGMARTERAVAVKSLELAGQFG
jgi:hypothetical protein